MRRFVHHLGAIKKASPHHHHHHQQVRHFISDPNSMIQLFTSPWGLLMLLYGRVGSNTSGSSSTKQAAGAGTSAPVPPSSSQQMLSMTMGVPPVGTPSPTTPPSPTAAAGSGGTLSSQQNDPENKAEKKLEEDPNSENLTKVQKAKKRITGLGNQVLGNFGIQTTDQKPWYQHDAIYLAGIILLMSSLWEFAKNREARIRQLIQEHCYVTLEVRTYQEEYDMILEWLSAQPIGKDTRNLTIKTYRHELFETTLDGDRDVLDFEDDWIAGEEAFTPGYGIHRVKYQGRTLYVTRDIDSETSKNAMGGNSRNGENAVAPNEVMYISIMSRNRKIIEDWMTDVRKHMIEKRLKRVPIYTSQRYGGWERLCYKVKRPLDTLYLPEEISSIGTEIKSFFDSKDLYTKLGVPWRRGYLMDGPPGTGKSSLITAIAGELNLPIYLLNIKGADCNDTSLLTMVNTIPKRSLLVLEDLDTAISKQDWEKAKKAGTAVRTLDDDEEEENSMMRHGVSISGLLNAIDGIAASEGRVMFVTANHPEVFPEALLRPGRIDRRLTFTKMGNAEVERMFQRFAEGTGQTAQELLEDVTGVKDFKQLEDMDASPAEWQNRLLARRLNSSLKAKAADSSQQQSRN